MAERFQYSLKELLVVVLILGAFIGLTLKFIKEITQHTHHDSKRYFAKSNISALGSALERYRLEFGHYPPDVVPGLNGSEILHEYLCCTIRDNQGTVHGPFLAWDKSRIVSGANGTSQIVSPFLGTYVYKIVGAKGLEQPLIIDSGPDKLLGGTIDPQKGFVPDNSDANHDGVPDDKDNITNETAN
jgi:hypothetical protein